MTWQWHCCYQYVKVYLSFTAATKNTNHTAHTLSKSSMLRQAENKRSPSKVILSAEKNWLPFKLSLQSRHWPHIAACGGWHQGQLMPQQIWGSCSRRSADMQLSTAPTVGRRRRGNPDNQGEPNTHTHMHTFTLLKGLGLRTDSIHTVLNALCDYQWSKSIIYMSPECRLMHFRKLSVSLICLWEERWCVDVCVCVGVYGVV